MRHATERDRNLPSTKSTLAERLRPLVYLSSNWISRIGIFLVTAAAVSWLFTLPANLTGSSHPYLGLLTVFLLPALFFLGLALIPLGCVSSKLREAEIQAINAGAGTGLYAINPVP